MGGQLLGAGRGIDGLIALIKSLNRQALTKPLTPVIKPPQTINMVTC